LGWIVALLLVAAMAALILLGGDVAPPLSRGDAAPDFDLPTLSGEARIERGDLDGRVALVNFWATWCKPCEEEIPAMERLYQALHPEGFELLAISVDENREDVEAFQGKYDISFPILLDPDQAASRLYQTTGFPESILLDRQGRIVERYVGPRDWDHPDYLGRVRRLMQ
jgi:thiol-disulfide isomerase/thioredoxin